MEAAKDTAVLRRSLRQAALQAGRDKRNKKNVQDSDQSVTSQEKVDDVNSSGLQRQQQKQKRSQEESNDVKLVNDAVNWDKNSGGDGGGGLNTENSLTSKHLQSLSVLEPGESSSLRLSEMLQKANSQDHYSEVKKLEKMDESVQGNNNNDDDDEDEGDDDDDDDDDHYYYYDPVNSKAPPPSSTGYDDVASSSSRYSSSNPYMDLASTLYSEISGGGYDDVKNASVHSYFTTQPQQGQRGGVGGGGLLVKATPAVVLEDQQESLGYVYEEVSAPSSSSSGGLCLYESIAGSLLNLAKSSEDSHSSSNQNESSLEVMAYTLAKFGESSQRSSHRSSTTATTSTSAMTRTSDEWVDLETDEDDEDVEERRNQPCLDRNVSFMR